ncbi:MAG TPA: glycogen synthase GlgA [Methylophilaceae bacterium]
MRILFVTSEAFPLIKTGGLADVSGSLPAALNSLGADVRILIPGYPAVLEKLIDLRIIATMDQLPIIGSVKLLMGTMPETGVNVMAIQSPFLYERAGGPYINAEGSDWTDNPLRFGILSRVAANLASSSTSPLIDWLPDVVHCNDWQSGLTPAFIHFHQLATGMKHAKSILSIHNLAFQGNYGAEWVANLGLPAESYQIEGLEYYGQMSFLKAGVYYADHLATVSPTYGLEIQTPEYGFGMQGLLAKRNREIDGILNGIDLTEWNPISDPYLSAHYDAAHLENKSVVKQALQQQLGLSSDSKAPLLGVVSRLTYQKGLDMFLQVAEPLIQQGCQIALLGSGEKSMENGFKQLAMRYPQQVAATIGYNEPLSHNIMAGADLFIMPSRFEPCGLNQMYGLRYGTPSVVTRTGGLADSIRDATPTALGDKSATGFVMAAVNADALLHTIARALTYFQEPKLWKQIQQAGMKTELGWDKSAQAYLNLYKKMLLS